MPQVYAWRDVLFSHYRILIGTSDTYERTEPKDKKVIYQGLDWAGLGL